MGPTICPRTAGAVTRAGDQPMEADNELAPLPRKGKPIVRWGRKATGPRRGQPSYRRSRLRAVAKTKRSSHAQPLMCLYACSQETGAGVCMLGLRHCAHPGCCCSANPPPRRGSPPPSPRRGSFRAAETRPLGPQFVAQASWRWIHYRLWFHRLQIHKLGFDRLGFHAPRDGTPSHHTHRNHATRHHTPRRRLNGRT